MKQLVRYVARRLAGAVVSVVGVIVVVFVVLHLTGNPAAVLVPPGASHHDYVALRHDLGLDKSLPVQFAVFFRDVLRGDFGSSYRWGGAAMPIVLAHVPATALLAVTALAIALLVAVPLGILSAMWRNSVLDRASQILAFAGQAMPVFWLGPMLILLFAVQLRVLPTSGEGGVSHLVLPGLTLAMLPLGQCLQITRVETAEALEQDYVRTARAKGVGARTVTFRHAFRNALLPLVTLVGLNFGTLLSGAVITETIFAWPGIGQLMIQAIYSQDFPIVESIVFLIGVGFVAINFAIDMLYVVIDPRVRLQ